MSTKNNVSVDKIGERIKEFRIHKGLTLVQLANLIRISHGSLSGLENNKSKPSAETLANFCLYTDIDIEWLLTGKENYRLERLKILDDLEEWIAKEIKINPGRKEWFEIQLLDSLSAFKTWKEEREGKGEFKTGDPIKKVA